MKRKGIVLSVVIFVLLLSGYLIFDLFKNYEYKNGKFIPIPGYCLVLQDKYCNKAVLIKNPFNPSESAVAFNLPRRTPIFSPIDGEYFSPVLSYENDTLSFSSKGYVIKQNKGNLINKHTLLVSLDNNDRFVGSKKITKGEMLTTITTNNISEKIGKYNLVFIIEDYNATTNNIIINSENIRKLFLIKK